ncbi:MAG TPA: FtsX-like permease family protein [Pseudobacteroides sp.]|uniref:FtsX-like permease family protein n=1 Tax=Pseudobacteroides sp. TaxID=1968840 RepID=UPI002F93A688
MIKTLQFFYIYHIRSWKTQKIQVALSILAIAMGLAIALAIQLITAYNVKNLEANAERVNGGDISIVSEDSRIKKEQVDYLESLGKSGDIQYTKTVFYKTNINYNQKSSMIIIRFVDFKKYPLYKDSELSFDKLNSKNDIIISSNVASRLNVIKDKKVRIFNSSSGEANSYRIAEIVKSDGEPAMDMNIFGYAYMDMKYAPNFVRDHDTKADKVYVKASNLDKVDSLKESLLKIFPYCNIQTSKEVYEAFKGQIGNLKSALSVISIITFIIGGIGIANTMIISILRREKEISILRVFGLRRKKIKRLIMMESALFSILSSLIGVPMGIIFSNVINYMIYDSWMDFSDISFALFPAAIAVAMSIIVSILFSVIPVSICNRMNVISVLREQYVKAEDKIRVAFPVMFITFGIGILFSIYSGSLLGLLYSILLLFLGCILYITMSIIIRLISRITIVNNYLFVFASKNLRRQYKSISIVLITLVVGVMSIGIIINISNSVLPGLKSVVENQFGYNVIVSASDKSSNDIKDILDKDKTVKGYSYSLRIDTYLKSLNGISLEQKYIDVLKKSEKANKIKELAVEGVQIEKSKDYFELTKGRYYSDEEKNKNVVILSEELSDEMGIKINDTLEIAINGKNYGFNVIGIRKSGLINSAQIFVPLNVLKDNTNWNSVLFYVNTDGKDSDGLVRQLNSSIDSIFVQDINDLLPSLNKVINQQIVLFMYIAIFCILSAIFLMSNITLMTFRQRIKEFILIKVMGAKTKNLLKIIFWESLIIGIVGGCFAIALSEVATSFFMNMFLKTPYELKLISFVQLLLISISIVTISTGMIIPGIKIKQLNTLLRAE